MEPAAIQALGRRRQTQAVQPTRHHCRCHEVERRTRSNPEHPDRERLLPRVPAALPARVRTHLLHHETATRGELGSCLGQQPPLLDRGEQVEHVDERDSVPRPWRHRAGLGDLEGEARAGSGLPGAASLRRPPGRCPRRRCLRLSDLVRVDIDADERAPRLAQCRTGGEQAVAAADLKDPPRRRQRGRHLRKGCAPPAHVHMYADGRRRTRVEGQGGASGFGRSASWTVHWSALPRSRNDPSR